MAEILSSPPSHRATRQPRRMTLEAYFRAEEKAADKHEFHNGVILKMAGAKLPHNMLAQKAARLIDTFVEEKDLNYIVSNSDTKIRIEQFDKVVYPDAVVICEKPDYFQERQDIITNPLIVVEVLSKSTEKYDRTGKFDLYRTLPSFKEYMLVSQEYKHVSVYTKQPDNTWILRDYDGDEATAVLYSLHECPISLKRLYRGLV